LKYLFLLLLCIFFISACQSDLEKCEEAQHMGNFYMLQDSKSFLAYQENQTRVIFSDSLDTEYVGNINRYNTFLGLVLSSKTELCPYDEDIILEHRHNREVTVVEITFPELNLNILCNLSVMVDTEYNNSKEIYDELSIFLRNENSTSILTSMGINIQNRNDFIPTVSTSVFHEDFDLLGRSYKNVFSHNDNYTIVEDYELYYNKTQGIVGFKSLVDPKFSYKFERIE